MKYKKNKVSLQKINNDIRSNDSNTSLQCREIHS